MVLEYPLIDGGFVKFPEDPQFHKTSKSFITYNRKSNTVTRYNASNDFSMEN